MTTPDPIDPTLESNLRALSTYTGEPTSLWQSALDQHSATRPASHNKLKLTLTLLSAAAIITLAVGLMLPALGKARFSVGRIGFDGEAPTLRLGKSLGSDADELQDRSKQDKDSGRTVVARDFYIAGMPSAATVAAPPGDITDPRADPISSPRSVIRKATIELAVPDARETFAKIQHLLRADLGEFVEGSSLTGQDKETHAQLTLRVAATRLDEVLNTLRTLGKIDSENATGDDVSATVVDLDAHLRNEKQVECEVLKLLESRKDAQLKDILELRDKLSSIRATIESLQGRRDTLGRQISLATILVLIRPDNAPKPTPSSLFDSFSHEMSAAWTSGLNALTQTLGFLIRIAIGGLIWWLLLFAAIAIARRAIRRWLPDPAAVPTSV
jgi:hypothetical protein